MTGRQLVQTFVKSLSSFAPEKSTRMSWKRLIHFEDEHGTQAFGEPDVKDVADFYLQLGNGSLSANVLRGDDMFALRDTNEKVRVQKLLPILTPKDVPLIKCIGLNCKNPLHKRCCTPRDHACWQNLHLGAQYVVTIE